MNRFVFLTVNGVTQGMIYATVAIALVLIFRTTRTINFAAGAMGVASAYAGLSVIDATGSYPLGLLAALVAGGLLGAIIQLTVFRSGNAMPHLNVIVVGIGLLVVVQSVLAMVYGAKERRLAAAFSDRLYTVADVPLFSRQDLFVVVSVLLLMISLGVLLTRTALGLRLRTAAFAPDVARLHGVRVGRMMTLGWAMAGVAGALAAMLVVPSGLGLSPQAMDGVFVLGFTAAVIGGLDSPAGAVLGGVVAGLVLSYTNGYVSSELTYVGALVLLLCVLLARPEGILGTTRTRHV